VTIYSSDYGQERMKEEELMGPSVLKELKGHHQSHHTNDTAPDESEDEHDLNDLNELGLCLACYAL
jgi:hypothetical protein